MTKVNIESNTQYDYTLLDLDVGDFFLDIKDDNHLCLFLGRETDNVVRCYDFCLKEEFRYPIDKTIDYLPNINITY